MKVMLHDFQSQVLKGQAASVPGSWNTLLGLLNFYIKGLMALRLCWSEEHVLGYSGGTSWLSPTFQAISAKGPVIQMQKLHCNWIYQHDL